jgi:hypothetical protein
VRIYRKIINTNTNTNKHTISEFINTLSNESWDMVFNNNNNDTDVDDV